MSEKINAKINEELALDDLELVTGGTSDNISNGLDISGRVCMSCKKRKVRQADGTYKCPVCGK